jgi:hypothetical protein
MLNVITVRGIGARPFDDGDSALDPPHAAQTAAAHTSGPHASLHRIPRIEQTDCRKPPGKALAHGSTDARCA